MNDIYEAGDGFFLSVADEIDFDDPREMYLPVKKKCYQVCVKR